MGICHLDLMFESVDSRVGNKKLSIKYLRYNTDVPIARRPQLQPTLLQKASAPLGSVPPSPFSMNNAIIELTKNYAIASFKPHLNYHECYLSLVVSQKISLPLKMYPED